MFAGEFFVTPHAVRQFQSRIAPRLTYEQALGAVIRELRAAPEPRPTENGKAHYVRTRGEWKFRAVIAAGEDGAKPAVITILRSGKSKKRSHGAEERGQENWTADPCPEKF